jgi:hypothetical protein
MPKKSTPMLKKPRWLRGLTAGSSTPVTGIRISAGSVVGVGEDPGSLGGWVFVGVGVFSGTSVSVGVAVGGTSVGVFVGVAVGGTGVSVGVGDGVRGSGVSVGVGEGPSVGVLVAVAVGVSVGTSVGVSVGVDVGVSVGGTGVFVGVSVGGTGVFVGVDVGGTSVSVGVFVGSCGVFVGETGVSVGTCCTRKLSELTLSPSGSCRSAFHTMPLPAISAVAVKASKQNAPLSLGVTLPLAMGVDPPWVLRMAHP